MKSLIDIHRKVLSRNREQNIFTIIISLLKLFTFSSDYYKTERKRVSTIIIHYFACVKIHLVMWNRQTDKQTDIERQTDIDGWWCKERETEGGSVEGSVSTVTWFPLFVGVWGLFAVPNQCWNLLHSSPVPIQNTHIHIHSYMHPLSPDASPSLPSLASKKTFPGKNETVLMTPLS